MKVISRVKKDDYHFVCQKSFLWDGKITEPGEEIVIKERADQDGMIQRGAVRPSDLPEVGIYIALGEITLPGRKEKFTCKKLELIELTSEQALRLMIEGKVIPRNPDQWRFHNRKLGKPKSDQRFAAQLSQADQNIFEKEFSKKRN